mgnify:CR=1 FL=1
MPGGQPTKLTAKLAERLVELVRAGATITLAAETCGAKPQTVREWIRRGKGDDKRKCTPLYAAFAADMAEADEYLEGILLHAVITGSTVGFGDGPPDIKTGLALLKSRWPDKYNPNRHLLTSEQLLASAAKVAAEYGIAASPELLLQRAEEIARSVGSEDL